ncbi:MAG TPA: hypothetical protein DEU95_04570, partial [Chloroflexi bacterium]|nr:hypothetical protein [Chloroflexota bacterium]
QARERVEEAIAALGYYPNELARSLRIQQTSTVGLVIPNSANPFYAEIARELDVPKSTIQRRLDALIREQVVRFAAYADSERLGLNIHVHLNLRVELASYQSVIDAVGQLVEVRWLAVTTGPYDLVAEAYFVSSTHLHEFIRDRLATIPGITGVETSVILKVEKLAFHWDALLREARRHAGPHVRMVAPARVLESGADEDGERR